MTFASKKVIRDRNSSLSKKQQAYSSLSQSRTFLTKNSQNRSNIILLDNPDPAIRIEKIESNLAKICSQNEVLMPLLNMTSSLPIFSKTENEIKEFQKKMNENEKALYYFEEGFEKYKEYFEEHKYKIEMLSEEKFIDDQQIEKQIKTTNNHLNALHSNLKDVENTVINLQNLLDKKFTEETKVLKETVENKLKKNKREIQSTLKESESRINTIFKEHEENLKKYNLFKVYISFPNFIIELKCSIIY